ncbi:antibiotic biosynthesis monooxygenase [Streptomyces zinciresistens K42]|uniref:Antibiotic biosynthesis monooxygenase n=1 Tax=Streptomyces zinciresistens K42 TaxID=700597 RepID=G2GE61_9ACTN|nr:antibiotic biosynthesis monooxygenase [Streptomyces zinciresistens]EGX58194.1 antibiotic biosynthesis monooxygenase [Streptomyces zinciresistens K42]
MTETDNTGPTDVTLLTARAVEPGYEQDFREWFGRVTSVASAFPGHLGDGLFRPPTAAGPWVVIHRFRDQESAQHWTASPERAALFDHCEGHHQSEVARRELVGMETLFTAPQGTNTVSPPRWKMALAAFAAVLPISLIGNGLLGPALSAWPLPARVLILALLFSTAMTYLMMPTVTLVLRRWLYATTSTEAQRLPSCGATGSAVHAASGEETVCRRTSGERTVK